MTNYMDPSRLTVHGLTVRDADAATGDGLTLEGIAVPFGRRYDLCPGVAEVFDHDTEFGSRAVKISRDHGDLIGRVTRMEPQADGLHVTARLSDTSLARETAQLIRDGVLDAFSVGFRPEANLERDADDGVVEIHRRKVDLYEIAVTGIPAYPDAQITTQRSQTTSTTTTEDIMNEDHTKIDDIAAQVRDIQATLADGAAKTSPAFGAAYRTAGDYLLGLIHEEPEAVTIQREGANLITTGDTGDTTTWIADMLRLIAQRRKVTNILTHDTLPDKGMSMEYHVVTSDSTAVSKQANEGAQLPFGAVKFGTQTADIATYGGYTTLSRQVIERSTTPMLNTALTALTNAYAAATENAVRTYVYDLIREQRDATSDANKIDAPATLGAMTVDQWAGLILSAAEVMDDRNANMTRLVVSKDVALALIALKDSGDRFMDISGKGDIIGSFDLTGVVGDLMRVPVTLLPKAPDGTAAFLDPSAVTVWESGGPTQLSDGDVTKLTQSYSVYGYMAVAATYTDGLLPIKFAAK